MSSTFFVDPNRSLTAAENGNPSFTGVSLHTSAQALPIPIVWGTRRVSPNTIWWSPLLQGPAGSETLSINTSTDPDGLVNPLLGSNPTVPFLGRVHVDPGGNDYGSDDTSNTSSVVWAPMIFALCEGPIDSVPRVWPGGGATPWPNGSDPVALNYPHLFFRFLSGSSAQTAWAYFTTNPSYYPSQNLAYRFTALIVSPLVDCGHGNTPPQYSYEVQRTPDTSYRAIDSYLLAFDYSLAAIIPDFLTSAQYGMGFASGDIDSASLLLAKQYWFAQGLYYSPLLNSQTAGTDIIDRWAQLSNCWIFWGGTAFYFVPLGDETLTGNGQTYTPDTTAAYDLSNNDFMSPLQVQRADPIDCANRVRIEISDRRPGVDYGTNPIEWKDDGLIDRFGIRDASDITADDICDSAVGAIVVALIGQRLAYIRNTYTFTLPFIFLRILPGTIVTLTDPNIGLDHLPVRVRSVEWDENFNLSLTAEEYPGTLGIARPTTGQAWLPLGGVGSGGGSTPTGGGSSAPISTSGGGITLTPGSSNMILYVAGDVCALPDPPTPGQVWTFVHDQQRVPQPTPAILESNAVHFTRASGSWGIADPQDGTLAPASDVTGRTTGTTYRFAHDGGSPGIYRCVS